MLKLIIYRLLQGTVVLVIISFLIFWLLAAAGGDALTALRNNPLVSQETLAELSRSYGLDQPLTVRYTHWFYEVAHGRLGHSFYFKIPVGRIIWPCLIKTFLLAAVAISIAWAIALALGITAARHAGTWIDGLCSALVTFAASTPRLVLALATLALVARTTWFDAGSPIIEQSVLGWLSRLLPPALVLSVPLVALFLAQTRVCVREMLDQDFVRAARAKGLPERIVLFRHVLRPSLNPLITTFGYSLGKVMGGSVIVEKVLGWPGLGQLSVTAVRSRDVPLLMGIVLVTAAAVLVGNLLADIFLRMNDPRLRRS